MRLFSKGDPRISVDLRLPLSLRYPGWSVRRGFHAAYNYLATTKLAYAYAGPDNAGDHASYLGIRSLASTPGYETLCSEFAVARKSDCFVIVGGGGLIQPVFESFWHKLLESQNRFALFGIGENIQEPHRPRFSEALLYDIARNADYIHVRDHTTANSMTKVGASNISVGLCPSVNLICDSMRTTRVTKRNILLHAVHSTDLRFAGIDEQKLKRQLRLCSRQLKLQYREVSHECSYSRSLLSLYQRSAIVVSSRLHACIFSFATNTPFIAIGCDNKTGSFLRTHVPSKQELQALKATEIDADLIALEMKNVALPPSSASLQSNRSEMRVLLDKIQSFS